MTRLYLDYNATAPLLAEARDAMVRSLAEHFGNPSSIHLDGQRAKAVLDEARQAVAALIGGDPAEVVFTSGGTEADNFAIRGVADALAARGRRHLVASTVEHEAVLMTMKALARRGWEVSWVPVDGRGLVAPDALARLVRPDTAVVSVMHANNELGTIQPIGALAAVAHEAGAIFHTDAVQSAGKIEVDVRALGVDLLSISGHKFGGPKGVGALWIRKGIPISPIQTGGRQERNRRAGTENVPALAGMGAAARVVLARLGEEGPRLASLRDRLEAGILARVPGTLVNGAGAPRVPNTTNLAFDGVEAEALLIALDLEGLAVSTGSACSSGTLEPSHVLRALGLPPERTQNAIRVSLGPSIASADIDRVLEVLPRVVARIRAVGTRHVSSRDTKLLR